MLALPAPPCPDCNRLDAKAVKKRLDYPIGAGCWNAEPISKTFTYQCICGLAFTATVKIEPQAQPA